MPRKASKAAKADEEPSAEAQEHTRLQDAAFDLGVRSEGDGLPPGFISTAARVGRRQSAVAAGARLLVPLCLHSAPLQAPISASMTLQVLSRTRRLCGNPLPPTRRECGLWRPTPLLLRAACVCACAAADSPPTCRPPCLSLQ